MAKYYGFIGYGLQLNTSPGVWEDVITERSYYGDVVRNVIKSQEAEKVNLDLTIGNAFSIVADAFAYENFFAMRYISWSGTLWTVRDVEVRRPRLLIRVGGVYHGPKAAASDDS